MDIDGIPLDSGERFLKTLAPKDFREAVKRDLGFQYDERVTTIKFMLQYYRRTMKVIKGMEKDFFPVILRDQYFVLILEELSGKAGNERFVLQDLLEFDKKAEELLRVMGGSIEGLGGPGRPRKMELVSLYFQLGLYGEVHPQWEKERGKLYAQWEEFYTEGRKRLKLREGKRGDVIREYLKEVSSGFPCMIKDDDLKKLSRITKNKAFLKVVFGCLMGVVELPKKGKRVTYQLRRVNQFLKSIVMN